LGKNNFLLLGICFKIYILFAICILRFKKVLLWPKKPKNTLNSYIFLALAFFRGICLSRHRIWNQDKILCFLDTHIDIFNFFLVKRALFAILKWKWEKNVHFQIFCKNKSNFLFFQVIIILRVIPINFETLNARIVELKVP
jgi:hypothetical protein